MTVEKRIEAALRAPLTEEHRSTLDARMQAAIAAVPAVRKHGFRIHRSVALAAILLVVPIVGAGAAIMRTEDPFGLANATEFAAELDVAKAEVALPPGRGWPAFLRVDDPDAGYSKGGGRSWVEGVAICLWLDAWLDARIAGDATAEAAAASTIASVPTWPSWTSPFWTIDYTDHLQPLIDAVATGHEGPIKLEMQSNCEFATL